MLWYWADWNSGTGLLSRFLKGCYMDLLHAQFNNGPLTLEEIKTVLGSDFGQSWPALQKKFEVNETGKFFNVRMEREKNNRKNFSKKQADKVKKRWDKYRGNTVVYTESIPIVNTNENSKEEKEGLEEKETIRPGWWPQLQKVIEVFAQYGGTDEQAQVFFNKYEGLEWKTNGSEMKRWNFFVPNFIKNFKKIEDAKSIGTDSKQPAAKGAQRSNNLQQWIGAGSGEGDERH